MQKQFDKWCTKKKKIQHRDVDADKIIFREREVWWCAIGVNIGYEQDGKNKNFERPVLIYRKFNKHIFLGIPFTTQPVDDSLPFYMTLRDTTTPSSLILSQVRLYDSRRLLRHIRTVSPSLFNRVKTAMKSLQQLE